MKKIIFKSALLIFIGALFSCKSTKPNQSNFSFSETYENIPYTAEGESQLKGDILELFQIYDFICDSVQISIKTSDELQLKIFTKKGNEYSTFFKGKLKKRFGYFEIYHHKRRKEVPPLIPIFYSSVDIYKIRIYYIFKDLLKITEHHENFSNIFLMAGGSTTKNDYFFKALKKN